jgi:hypothetical protein
MRSTMLARRWQCTLVFILLMLTLPMFAPSTVRTHAASAAIQQPKLLDGRDVLTFNISPNSRQGVYQAGSDIYSIALAGGSPVELRVPPVSSGASFQNQDDG